jgi:hypothetical protein
LERCADGEPRDGRFQRRREIDRRSAVSHESLGTARPFFGSEYDDPAHGFSILVIAVHRDEEIFAAHKPE